MKRVPLKELKGSLSKYLSLAAKGERIEVTKHSKLFVVINGVPDLIVGKDVGKKEFTPLENIPEGLAELALKMLDEDRGE